MAKNNKKRISMAGSALANVDTTIILQQPDIFYFNMRDYISSIQSAQNMDFTQRVRLYDMYESTMLDLHLRGVISKRLRGVTRFPIEFRRDGVADEIITPQLSSPWFKSFKKEIINSEFWGFSAFQFYTDEKGYIRYTLIPRKHFDPIRKQVLKYEGALDSGIPMESFDNTLFVGDERDLGIYAELLPAVLYKRGDISDWSQFCNIFGMPIREYTYDAGDEEARKKTIEDARKQGANAVYIHPTESKMNLIESGNKTGSSDLYKSFAEYWDSQMSIRVLGNTLTTDAKETGTQALGTVHKSEENDLNEDDREFILDVLNYHMKPIFNSLGFNTDGGEFVYAYEPDIDTEKQLKVVETFDKLGVPLDDDWLYDTFNVRKPDNYDELLAKKEEAKKALLEKLQQQPTDEEEKDDPKNKKSSKGVQKSFKNYLNSFFGIAPTREGATDF